MPASGNIQKTLDTVFGAIGLQPDKLLMGVARAVLSIRDTGKRLAAIEASGMVGAYYLRSVRLAVEGDNTETASKVKDALLEAQEQASVLMATLADKDGSLSRAASDDG